MNKLSKNGTSLSKLLTALCLLMTTLPSIRAALSEEARAALSSEMIKPIQVYLNNGRNLLGHSIKVQNNTLKIATSSGAGEAIYSFEPNEIKRFEIPGEAYKTLAIEQMRSGETESALEIMSRLYEQRLNLIPYLPDSEANFFTLYVDLLKEENPSRAIAVAETLAPLLQNPKAIELIEAARMEGYYQMEMYADAHRIASLKHSKGTPYDNSALSTFILSEQALREKDYETAIALALEPIIFSGPNTTDKLADCYAVAISAAIRLREHTYAQILYKEMQERELLWPTQNQTLQPFHEKLLKKLKDA